MSNDTRPEIRFPGFTEDWEQRKLGEIAQKVSVGIATSSSEYFTEKETGVPFVKNQNVKENWIDDSDLEFITHEFDEANRNKRLKTGDILTVRTGYPGLSAVVPSHLEGAQTFTTLITRLKQEIALPEYVSAFINSDAGMKQITGMEAGGAQKNVNAGILQNLLIDLPSLAEQKAISDCTKLFDTTITLQQRKLDLLKETKKGFLQKMFPKDGASVPEIRFPGFTEDWEERKLSEVADIVGGGTPDTNNPEYWNGDIDWYAPAEIGEQIYVTNSQRKISQLGIKKSSAKILPVGTVLFTSRAGIGNTAILAKEGTTNQGFQSIVPHEKDLDSYFIFSRTHELKRYGEVTGAGSTFVEVSGKQMSRMPMLFPSFEEQQKIGIFFKQLDDTITLHQRKLDLLKETKKGFLQKMFV